MINLLNLEVLKKLLISFILLTFALVIYLFFHLTFAEEAIRTTTNAVATSQTITELSGAVGTEVWDRVRDLPLEKAALTKLLQDIVALQMAEQLIPDCEQYVLRVVEAGRFPVLQTAINDRPEIKTWIWLNVGEQWRCGMTQHNESTRYPSGIFFISKDGSVKLTRQHLVYDIEFKGTLMQVLIEEKIKIYTYSLREECVTRVSSGGQFLALPPGNKVHK